MFKKQELKPVNYAWLIGFLSFLFEAVPRAPPPTRSRTIELLELHSFGVATINYTDVTFMWEISTCCESAFELVTHGLEQRTADRVPPFIKLFPVAA